MIPLLLIVFGLLFVSMGLLKIGRANTWSRGRPERPEDRRD